MTLGDLVNALGGTLVQGSPETLLIGVDDVSSASSMDLVFAEDANTVAKALASGASAVVLAQGMTGSGAPAGVAIVEADQPRLWFSRAAAMLHRPPISEGVHPTAIIGPLTEIGEGVTNWAQCRDRTGGPDWQRHTHRGWLRDRFVCLHRRRLPNLCARHHLSG